MIREVEKNDYESLANFLSEYSKPALSRESHLERFRIWWDENPSFENDKRGWVIDKEGSIEGFLANIPANYKVGSEIITTASPSTWCVNPKSKKEAISLIFPYVSQKKDLLVNSTPAEVTEEIFIKLGFEDISKNLKSYIHILNSKTLYHFLSKKMGSSFVTNVISKVGILFLKLINAMTVVLLKKVDLSELETYDVENSKSLLLDKPQWLKEKKFKIRFFKEGNEGSSNIVVTQYVENKANGLNYIEVLHMDRYDLGLLRSSKKEIFRAHGIESADFIIVNNCERMNASIYAFFDVSRFLRNLCLVKGKALNKINGMKVTSMFGEKGFMLWS